MDRLTSYTGAISALALCVVLSHTPAAQQPVPVAYPQDTTDGGWMHCAPLGQNVGGGCNEATSQILIPRAHLPSTGGMILGIEVVPQLTQTVTYQRLDITVDHIATPGLSFTFGANLSAAATQVLSLAPNSSINYLGRTWTPIPFTTPFVYNGTDNLVLELRKIVPQGGVDTYMIVPSNPRRFDLPRHINVLGPGASNASTALNHAVPIRLRLMFASGPGLTVQSNRGGTYNFVFALGQQVTMTAYGGSGSLYVHLAEFAGSGLQPAPRTRPPLLGASYLNLNSPLLFTMGVGTINGTGRGASTFNMPNAWFMVGQQVALQGVVLTPSGFAWTPATDAIVNW